MTVLLKRSIIDVFQGSEYARVAQVFECATIADKKLKHFSILVLFDST